MSLAGPALVLGTKYVPDSQVIKYYDVSKNVLMT